jgi:hypothetical protein
MSKEGGDGSATAKDEGESALHRREQLQPEEANHIEPGRGGKGGLCVWLYWLLRQLLISVLCDPQLYQML